MARTITVYGNYGNRNLGDEATLQALVEHVRARVPGAGIVAFSMDPSDTATRHGIRAVPSTRAAARLRGSSQLAPEEPSVDASEGRARQALRRIPALYGLARAGRRTARYLVTLIRDPLFELRCFRTMRQSDSFVLGGGGQLCDQWGVFSTFPFQLLKWTLLARLAGRPVLVLNVGAGPLRRPLSRFLVRSMLALTQFRSFRDEPSRRLVETIGARTPLEVYPDLAYGLSGVGQMPDAPAEGQVVGLNVFPHFDGRYLPSSGDKYVAYLECMASFATWLLADGYTVALFPTQLRADPPVLRDLKALLAMDPAWETLRTRLTEPSVATVDDLVGVLRSAALVVTTRYHGIVLSLALGRPVLALSNHSKMEQAMIDMGQAEYVFPVDGAQPDRLAEAFRALEAGRAEIHAELESRASARRALLEQEFDELFGKPPPRSA